MIAAVNGMPVGKDVDNEEGLNAHARNQPMQAAAQGRA
jgi:hypothetical protein